MQNQGNTPTKAPALPFRHLRKVSFHETDKAGILHFSNYFRYMEAAEDAFFEQLGFALLEEGVSRVNGWPRVKATCEYLKPLTYRDLVAIDVEVSHAGAKSLTFDFRIYKLDAARSSQPPATPERPMADGEEWLVARGQLVTVYASFDRETAELRAVPVPEPLLSALSQMLNNRDNTR